MLITTSLMRYNSKLIFALLFFSLTTLSCDLPADASAERGFRMAACSTIDFKRFHRGADMHCNGGEATVAEIWHDREHAPERALFEAELPSAGLRINHIARKVWEKGGGVPSYHEVTSHTLLQALVGSRATITSKRVCVDYSTSVHPYITVEVPPTKETVDSLLADVACLRPFFARTKPDSLAQKMADEIEEMRAAGAGAGAGAGSK